MENIKENVPTKRAELSEELKLAIVDMFEVFLENNEIINTVNVFDCFIAEDHEKFAEYCEENEYYLLSDINQAVILDFRKEYLVPDYEILTLVNEISEHVIEVNDQEDFFFQ